MDRRVKENLLYVGEGLVSRFGKLTLGLALFLALCAGFIWGFQKVDAYLTPSWIEEEITISEKAFITIPKIGVEAPITFVQSVNPAEFLQPLKNGVAHYPSALPGKKGVSIILGHSAPAAWFGNAYDDIFSDLKNLEQGDRIFVSFHGEMYSYEVQEKLFLSRGQDVPARFTKSEQVDLLLLSCWPPGINNKRIGVQATLL